jgi:hypothetical protein
VAGRRAVTLIYSGFGKALYCRGWSENTSVAVLAASAELSREGSREGGGSQELVAWREQAAMAGNGGASARTEEHS